MTSKAFGLAQLGNAYSDGALSNRSKIINGAMTIDQRNAGAAVSADGYTLDRWVAFENTSATSVTAQKSTTAPAGFTNSLLYTVGTGGSAGASEQAIIRQRLEGNNVSDLAFGTASAQNITVSFCVRSSVIGTYSVAIQNSAGDRAYVATYTVDVADTWETKSIIILGDTSGTWLTDNGIGMAVLFDLGSGSGFNTSAGAWVAGDFRNVSGQANVIGTSGATFYLTGVQLEAGDTATPFEHRSYGAELALCQRYFYTNATSGFEALNTLFSTYGSTYNYLHWHFKVSMRAAPTIAGYTLGTLEASSTEKVSAYSAGSNYAAFGFNGSAYGQVTASAEL